MYSIILNNWTTKWLTIALIWYFMVAFSSFFSFSSRFILSAIEHSTVKPTQLLKTVIRYRTETDGFKFKRKIFKFCNLYFWVWHLGPRWFFTIEWFEIPWQNFMSIGWLEKKLSAWILVKKLYVVGPFFLSIFSIFGQFFLIISGKVRFGFGFFFYFL